jgi:hypothetical protein
MLMKTAGKVFGGVALGVLTLAVLVGTAPSAAGQAGKAKTNGATAVAKSQGDAKPHSGPQEGIKVHGHWTIVVRNADGSVASRHEFENVLMPTGKELMAKILARNNSAGTWAIRLDSAQRVCTMSGQGTPCIIGESGSATQFPNLNVSFSGSLSGSEVILIGSAKADAAGEVSFVETLLYACPPQSPGCSAGATSFLFTQRILSPPIGNIVAGQTIDVTVRLSFS